MATHRRVDVLRNRASILDAAQRHFLAHDVGTSLEAVAKEAGVGPTTLYRHFPTREAQIELVENSGKVLQQWMRALEDYFGGYNGLPEPLLLTARQREPDNPLTLLCVGRDRTEELLRRHC